jgi:uncharacterized membrane protein
MKKSFIMLAITLFPLTACSEQNPIANTQQTEYERQVQLYDEQAKKLQSNKRKQIGNYK